MTIYSGDERPARLEPFRLSTAPDVDRKARLFIAERRALPISLETVFMSAFCLGLKPSRFVDRDGDSR